MVNSEENLATPQGPRLVEFNSDTWQQTQILATDIAVPQVLLAINKKIYSLRSEGTGTILEELKF